MGPTIQYVSKRGSLGDSAFFANHSPDPFQFLCHALIGSDYVIKCIRDLPGHAGPVIWQSRRKIPAFKCHQSSKQLFAV